MWDKFTREMKQAVFTAQGEAAERGHEGVSTGHLLLAALHEVGMPTRMMERSGIDLKLVRAIVIERLDLEPTEGLDFTLTEPGKKVLDLTVSEAAERWKDTFIGTEHFLLGLATEEHGIGGQVLRTFGADAESLRDTLGVLRAEDGEKN